MDCVPGYHICVPAAYGAARSQRQDLAGYISDFPQLAIGLDAEEAVGGDLQFPTGFYAHEVCSAVACLRYSLRYCGAGNQLEILSIGYPARDRSRADVPTAVSVLDSVSSSSLSLDEMLRTIRVSVGGAPAALKRSEVGPCTGPRGGREGLHSSRRLTP